MSWKSMGRVEVATAGTPVRVTMNMPTPEDATACHAILIQSDPTNTGKIWIMDRSTGSKVTFVGVLALLPPPTADSFPSASVVIEPGINAIRAETLFLDADVNGEGAIVSILRV